MKIVLTYPTETGLQEIPLEAASLSFGRGSEADYRFADDGLSRLHSIIYREGDQIWIVDENSTNGTFVNGQPVGASGTALENGDTIRIGNYTSLKVKFVEETAPVSTAKNQTKSAAVSGSTQSTGGLVRLIPIVAIVIAFFVISISAVVIGIKIFVKEPPPIVERDPDNDPTPDKEPTKETATPKPKTSVTPIGNTVGNENINSGDPLPTPDKIPDLKPSSGKKYSEMSEAERRAYVETKVQKVAAMIGNRSGGEIPPLAVDSIKQKLDGYFKRIRASRVDDCNQGSWVRSDMISVLERARKNAPFIIHSFNQEGVDPQVGLYLAMIESEHCVCLQSPTGPLGMFQFTKATGEAYGLQTIRGANPNNPDERCKPEPSARAAAKYMKFLTGRYGTGPASFPLAIASYNSGEGGLSKNLQTALNTDSSLSRDFWSLIANSGKLSKQFQDENFKYPPKFFAAAIIGENPQDFGVNLQPLSTYTK
ncbi:MAG: FHA domain-containing protein [Blastocatellia bacterium]|nr:FHA domain-containing protein [Blastocatellia bacterium]